jgi:hypothetical protein
MISRESLTKDFTANNCGRRISEDDGDDVKIKRVEGVEVVVPFGVFGGRVVSLR